MSKAISSDNSPPGDGSKIAAGKSFTTPVIDSVTATKFGPAPSATGLPAGTMFGDPFQEDVEQTTPAVNGIINPLAFRHVPKNDPPARIRVGVGNAVDTNLVSKVKSENIRIPQLPLRDNYVAQGGSTSSPESKNGLGKLPLPPLQFASATSHAQPLGSANSGSTQSHSHQFGGDDEFGLVVADPKSTRPTTSENSASGEPEVKKRSDLSRFDPANLPKHVEQSEEYVEVNFDSHSRSFGRMLDTLVGSPAYLMCGEVKKLPTHNGYTRSVEAIGHYRPNLVSSSQGRIRAWKPKQILKIDLSDKTHYCGVPTADRAKPEFFRVNLFCGFCVWISKANVPNYLEYRVFRLVNCRDFPDAILGILSGLTESDLDKFVEVGLETEIGLTEMALRFAKSEGVNPCLSFYRHPTHWLKDKLSSDLRLLINQVKRLPTPIIPIVEGIGDEDILLACLKQLKLEQVQPEITNWLESQYNRLTDEEKQIVKSSVADGLANSMSSPSLLSFVATPIEVTREEEPEEVELEVDFENQSYAVKASVQGTYNPLHDGFRPACLGCSPYLNELLDYAFEFEDIEIQKVEFRATFPTSCRSVVPKKPSPAIGYAKEGYFWQERLRVELIYLGPWFTSQIAGDLASVLNSQLLAEVIHYRAAPHLAQAPKLRNFAWVDREPKSYDSPHFTEFGELRDGFIPTEQLGTNLTFTGVWKYLPKDIQHLLLVRKGLVDFDNLQAFIATSQVPRFKIWTPGRRESHVYIPQEGDNLFAESDDDPLRWIANMRKQGVRFTLSDSDSSEFHVVEAKLHKPQVVAPPNRGRKKSPNRSRDKSPAKSQGSVGSQPSESQDIIVPKFTKEYEPGYWFSKRLAKLDVRYRMYIASRVHDVIWKKSNPHGISQVWVSSFNTYVPQPDLRKKVGTSSNFYVADLGYAIPTYFYEGKEYGEDQTMPPPLDSIPIPSANSRMCRFSHRGRPSFFYHTQSAPNWGDSE